MIRYRALSPSTGDIEDVNQAIGEAFAQHRAGRLAEARAVQTIKKQEELTPWLKFGDRVRIDMLDANGHSIFGSIDQLVVQHPVPRKRNEGAAEEVVQDASEAEDLADDAVDAAAESVDTPDSANVES